jgi:hypothetical protein
LILVGLGAATGVIADSATWMEHPHEAVAEVSIWLIGAHVAFVLYMYGGRKWASHLIAGVSGLRPAMSEKETAR